MRPEDTSILINISSSDKARIRERMKSAGTKNMSAYIRKQAIDGYIVVLDLSDVREVLRLLGELSSSVNRYIKKANELGTATLEDIEDVRQSQLEILNEMRKITNRLAEIY